MLGGGTARSLTFGSTCSIALLAPWVEQIKPSRCEKQKEGDQPPLSFVIQFTAGSAQKSSKSAKKSYILGKCKKRAHHRESGFLGGKAGLLLPESHCLTPSLSLQTDHLVSEHLQQPACLEADPAPQALRVNACDSANPRQKWQFGHYYAD